MLCILAAVNINCLNNMKVVKILREKMLENASIEK
jgi:hypothetical protein